MLTSTSAQRENWRRYRQSPLGKARDERQQHSERRRCYLVSPRGRELNRLRLRKFRIKHLNTLRENKIA